MRMKCNKHPKYRAVFAPRVECPTCLRMYDAVWRQEIEMDKLKKRRASR
jgi:hypothetical protein